MMEKTKEDLKYMTIALEQARISLSEENFPVGAVLVINGKLIGEERNSLHTNSDWISHAEMRLFSKYSNLIKQSIKEGATVTLYTTLEPCLMCLGTSLLHRVSRVVYACPDLFTGATCIKSDLLPVGYESIYPEIERGELKDESQELLMQYMSTHDLEKWKKSYELLKSL